MTDFRTQEVRCNVSKDFLNHASYAEETVYRQLTERIVNAMSADEIKQYFEARINSPEDENFTGDEKLREYLKKNGLFEICLKTKMVGCEIPNYDTRATNDTQIIKT